MGNFETITYEEAYSKEYLRKRALQFYRNGSTLTMSLPLEFTQFVLRNSAISERGCAHFERKLSFEVRKFLKGLIGRQDSDIEIKQIHCPSNDAPSGFRGVYVKYFFKKVIYNLRNEVGLYEYCDNFATIFPFQVLQEVPIRYDIEVVKLFDNGFYEEIQIFLDDHFENVNAREVGPLFLANINHFKATRFPEEALVTRVLQNQRDLNNAETKDYLSSFPRLNDDGIKWFQDFYRHYKNVCKIFDDVDVFLDPYDDNYFRTLPESNFIDLYELLSTLLYASRRKQYLERFEKYLFFFVHALQANTNPVFFIDDVLFECLKCLHSFKTSRQDVEMGSEIAKLSLVHLRTKSQTEYKKELNIYRIDPQVLFSIKKCIEKIPDIDCAQIDIEYKTDYLHGWMLLRIKDTCYEMCYSRRERKRVDDFVDRIMCSVLSPDDEPINYVVIYNFFKGQESRIAMPQNIESVRNFIRLSNTYDFVNDKQAESNDEFLTRDLDLYYDHLTIADEV